MYIILFFLLEGSTKTEFHPLGADPRVAPKNGAGLPTGR